MPKTEPDVIAERWAVLKEAVKRRLVESSRDVNHFKFDDVRHWITEMFPIGQTNHFMRAPSDQELLEQDPETLARDVLDRYKAWEAEHGS